MGRIHYKPSADVLVSRFFDLRNSNQLLSDRELLKLTFSDHSSNGSNDGVELEELPSRLGDFIEYLNEGNLVSDFFNEDVSGLPLLPGQKQLSPQEELEIYKLESEIKGLKPKPLPTLPVAGNHPLVPIQSSFVKGAGVYDRALLVEFHHSPGKVWGYQLSKGKAQQFFQDLMASGSKGAWVWDKLLGRPSQFGMAKGTFHAFTDKNGKDRFYTSKGAQFVHKKGRPIEFGSSFIESKVGFGVGFTPKTYARTAEIWKTLKEHGYTEFSQYWKGLGESARPWEMPTPVRSQGGPQPITGTTVQTATAPPTTPPSVKTPFEESIEASIERTAKGTQPKETKEVKKPWAWTEQPRGRGRPRQRGLREGSEDTVDDLTFAELGLKRRQIPKEEEDRPLVEGYEMPKQEWLEQLQGQLSEALKFKERYEDKLLSDDPKIVAEANKALNYLNESIEAHFNEIQELKRELTTFTGLGLKRKEGVIPEVSKAKEYKFEEWKSAKPTQSKLPKAEREARFQDRTDKALSALKNLRNVKEGLKKKIAQKVPQRFIEKSEKWIKQYEGELDKEISKLYPKDRANFTKKYELSHGKGRGWHGDPQGHREAALKGKRDMLVEDITKILDESEYLLVKATYNEQEPDLVYLDIIDSEGKKESVELNVNSLLELADKIKRRQEKKGRGWWGDPQGHSEASKKGKRGDFIINSKIQSKIEKIKEIEAKHPDVEVGFGISKSGKLTGKYEDSLIIGGINKGNIHQEARKELGDSLEYVVHLHPYDEQFASFFSFEDLQSASMLGFKPVIIYKDKSGKYLIKKMDNIPNREFLVNEYQQIFKEHEKRIDNALFTSFSNEEFDKLKEEITKETKQRLKDFESKLGIQNISSDGKGRGWHGEPERHSVASKKGKKSDISPLRDGSGKGIQENKGKGKCNTRTEWISGCISKHGSKGDNTMTNEQCIAASYKKFGTSNDFVDLCNFTFDFTKDSTIMRGPITHGRKSGHFEYRDKSDPNKIIKVFKDYPTLKELHSTLDYYPVIGTQGTKSHKAGVIGFTHKFEPHDDTEEIYAETVLFNDIVDISSIPEGERRQVSIGFDDEIIGNIQYVKSIDHLAMSLDNKEMGRCKLTGEDCYQEVVRTDFVEGAPESCPYGIKEVLTGVKTVMITKLRGDLKN